MEKNPNKMFQRGLILKYDDPIEIVMCIGNVAYKLKLLERLKLYPTFHVSFLKSYHHCPCLGRVQAKWNSLMIRFKFG